MIAVTGGARGIGLATARALAGKGHRIAIGDLDGDAAAATALQLGQPHLGLPLDVTKSESFTAFFDAAEREQGPLEVLINNAGVMFVGSFLDETDRASELMLSVNVLGVILGTRLAARRMLPRGRGQIINIASAASWMAPPGEATYAATKHAVLGLSDAVRQELAPHGIRVAAVMPGVVDTELAAGTASGRTRRLTPDEVATAVAGLVDHHRDRVFLPRELVFAAKTWRMLSPRAARHLGRLIGLEAVASRTDPQSRADYERRALGSSAQ